MADALRFGMILGLAVAAAIGGLLVVRRLATPARLQSNHDVVATLTQVSATAYAVLIAFAVVIVWQQHGDAEGFADSEANQVYDLYRLADAFPDSVRVPLQQQLHDYARAVIDDEWPLLARDRESPRARALLSEIWWAYTGEQRQFDVASPAYGESLERLSDLNDDRRERLLSAGSSVPAPVWFILLAGATITVAMTWFFGGRHLYSQVLLTAGFVVIVGGAVLVVRTLENPFDHAQGVQPDAFHQVIERMAADRAQFHR